jgi:hypothetical protein
VTNNWYKGLLGGILFLLAGMASAQQAATRVIIVKSSDNAYFTQSIEALTGHADKALQFKVIMTEDLADSIRDGDSGSLYVTLGQSAAEAVNSLDKPPRSISAYLTFEQFKRLEGKEQTAVLLDQTLNRYLAFCQLVLAAESVGILEQQPIKLEKKQSKLLEKLQLELRQYQIDRFNKLLPVLRQLLEQSDALLMLPRQSIYNRDSLKGVLLTSYRNRKPVISYSSAGTLRCWSTSACKIPATRRRNMNMPVFIRFPPIAGLRARWASIFPWRANCASHSTGWNRETAWH